ncbi:MAG: hypothetical protein AB7N65_05225 [Vicinamibacterales bacterium]
MHLRPSLLLAFVSAWLLVTPPAAFAQTVTGGGIIQESEFVVTEDASCSAADAYLDDNIVWGTVADNTACSMAIADDNIVWGTQWSDENIVWGTLASDDNIVWGTVLVDDNIVWGTMVDENIVWGTSVTPESYDF